MNNYFDFKKRTTINHDVQCCDMETWRKNSFEYSCCKHPNGFCIFLNPEEIDKYDEYKINQDPFSILRDFDNAFHKRRLKCTIDLIKSLNSESRCKLLDIGCGQGLLTNAFKKEFSDYDVYGLDRSITAIEYANSNFSNIDFVVADAYNAPFEEEYFDIIVCNNIWEHLPDPLNMLNSIRRILKINGQLIISTPSRYHVRNLVRALMGKNVILSKHHITEYTVGQIEEQLKFGGFKIHKTYSPIIKEADWKMQALKLIFYCFLRTIKSHHVLESTVFYSAIRIS